MTKYNVEYKYKYSIMGQDNKFDSLEDQKDYLENNPGTYSWNTPISSFVNVNGIEIDVVSKKTSHSVTMLNPTTGFIETTESTNIPVTNHEDSYVIIDGKEIPVELQSFHVACLDGVCQKFATKDDVDLYLSQNEDYSLSVGGVDAWIDIPE
jgi:hypothetical protein